MSQVWDCDYCKCVTRKPGPNCKNLNCSCHPAQNLQQQLEAAKLREAYLLDEMEADKLRKQALQDSIDGCAQRVLQLRQERDAALSALEIARTALDAFTTHYSDGVIHEAQKALAKISSPSAALAERDK